MAKKKSKQLKVNGLKCRTCGYTIYSRARHDFHYCACGSESDTGIFIDGGFDYMRAGYGKDADFEPVEITLPDDVYKATLYSDWIYNKDKYGWIDENGVHGKPGQKD